MSVTLVGAGESRGDPPPAAANAEHPSGKVPAGDTVML